MTSSHEMDGAVTTAGERHATSETNVNTDEQIVLAVLTYRRSDQLAELLPVLVQQACSERGRHRRIRISVVDNDPAGSAEATVRTAAGLAAGHGIEIQYTLEPVPGISAARNRALETSTGDDLLVFIDDDERPASNWLTLLLATRAGFGADVVQGPVVSQFETPPDSWTIAGGFFRRRRLATGTALDVAVTNNLLVDLRKIRGLGLRFDEDLGTTGGEDTLFTRLLHRAGLSMVWCAEAVVFDVVPADRCTRGWVMQRAVSTGNTGALVALKLAGDHRRRRALARTRVALAGGTRLIGGSGRALLGTVARSQAQQARGVRTALRGLGMTIGALGFAYHEYGRPGRPRVTRASGTHLAPAPTRTVSAAPVKAGAGDVH